MSVANHSVNITKYIQDLKENAVSYVMRFFVGKTYMLSRPFSRIGHVIPLSGKQAVVSKWIPDEYGRNCVQCAWNCGDESQWGWIKVRVNHSGGESKWGWIECVLSYTCCHAEHSPIQSKETFQFKIGCRSSKGKTFSFPGFILLKLLVFRKTGRMTYFRKHFIQNILDTFSHAM